MARGFKALHLVRPFLPFLPEVEPVVGQKLPHREKVIYTIIVFFIFLICSNIPLFGIQLVTGADPLHWMRAILASNKHSLMELGISPITTAGLFMQLLGDTIFKVDKNVREDHLLRNAAHKLLGILLTIGMASAYVLSGVYGSIAILGIGNAMLIILQLSFAGVMIMFLDELFQKGYGYGSAISLFIAANFCANVVWKVFSPTTINFGRGAEFEGAIIALIHLLVTRKDKIGALQEAFYRQNLPNVMNILATALVFLVVVYLQGFRVIVPVKPRRARGQQESFPIKLFYTNTMPIMLQSAFVSNMFFISQLLYTRFGGNFLVDLIGKWKVSSYGAGGSMPVGGIVYYLAPPASLAYIAENPFHFLVYTVFMLSACAFFSKIWMDVSGSSARDVAKQLKDQDVVIVGHRDCNMQKELNRYIPTAAAFGGVCLGMLTIMADSMGALGSGTGILLAVSTIYQYLEIFEKEKGEEIGILGF